MKKYLTITIGIISLMAFSYLVLRADVRQILGFFWSSSYYFLVYFALLFAFFFIIFRKKDWLTNYTTRLKTWYFFIFLPIAFFPLLRCYFKIPYVFCKVCPRKCPFGDLRPVIIPGFLFQNIDARFWCFKLCPLGTIQDYQSQIVKKIISLPKWLINIRYLFLIFTAVITVLLIFNDKVREHFFIGTYNLVWGTVIVALIIFILAFFIPRFWCNYFCPIGSFGDIVLKMENKLQK